MFSMEGTQSCSCIGGRSQKAKVQAEVFKGCHRWLKNCYLLKFGKIFVIQYLFLKVTLCTPLCISFSAAEKNDRIIVYAVQNLYHLFQLEISCTKMAFKFYL
jgi:hypothetical protein